MEPDPRLRRLNGHATAADAIERIRKLMAEGHDAGGWISRIEGSDRGR